MARHLTDETLLDVVLGAADGESRSHLDTCAACAGRVETAREGLALAQEVDVPEPSPLYWEAFQKNVGRRIENEGRTRPWAWLPVAATAALFLFAVPTLRQPSAPLLSRVVPAWSALPPADEDSGIEILRGLEIAEADLPMLEGGRDAAEALADLSDEEALALQDVLDRKGTL